jgi:hypothetical protein
MLKEVLTRYRKRAKANGVSGLLRDLSEELRSDAIPGALREAAHVVAGLLDGQGAAADGSPQGAIIINVSVAVAVGAPGKQADEEPSPEGAAPSEALVVASAVATAPALAKPPERVEPEPPPARGKKG